MESDMPVKDESELERQRRKLIDAKEDVEKLGGWRAFRSGEWVLKVISSSFKKYYEEANEEYFNRKYPGRDASYISKKLISVACGQATLAGTVAGAIISADEIVGLATAGELGVGIPANIAIAVATISAESLQVLKIQLKLVARLYRANGCQIDLSDSRDIVTIMSYAFGGAVADEAGRYGMKIGGKAAGQAAKKVFSKEVLRAVKSLGAKIGIKILQRQIVKYTIPLASMGIGAVWNYLSTRAIGKVATKHIESLKREEELHRKW